MTTQPSATPRTDALILAPTGNYFSASATDFRNLARTLETELVKSADALAAARAECERLRTLNENAGSALQWAKEELAGLRAENDRLKTCGIVELAAINPSVADYCKHWEARAERAELELAAARCPHVVSTAEGTHYCALAESTVAKLEAQLAEARKDSQRLDYLWDIFSHDGRVLIWLSSQNIRAAIDAAMTNSKNT